MNLVVSGKIGEPNATKCAVYSTRYDGMPILRVDKDGHVKSGAKCSYESELEDWEILGSGVGKGCSLIPTVTVS